MKVDAAEGANENANGALHAASVKIQTTVIWRYPLQAMEMTRRREAAGFGTELLNHRSAWPHANPCLPGSFWRAVIRENKQCRNQFFPQTEEVNPRTIETTSGTACESWRSKGQRPAATAVARNTERPRKGQTGVVSTAPCNVRLWMSNRKSGSSG